ncbi:hypothetical protein J4E80_007183 [Alternaria sp. BMP 0032]|nr:hypothetical protein J4E80_007183 [Alternaria sp. BMP 0032]
MARALPLIPWSKTSILTCRMHLNSSRIAQHAALDLFVLGFPHQANKLLESIHKYGLDTTTWDYYGHTTEEQLQGAWTTSDTFPTWARRADDADADSISTAGLPNDIATKAEEGTLSKEDVETVRERLNMKADATYRHAGETMTLGAVTQIALLAHEHRLATSLVEDNMKELYQYLLDNWDNPDRSGDETRHYIFRRQGLEECPGIWPVLASVKLGDTFGVRASDVDEYVKEGCALVEKRSTEGPARPYRSRTMAALVQMVDKNILTEREDSGEDTIPTVLKEGATEAQIAALEKRLSSPDEHSFVALPGGKLPDDYKDFLRASNGIDEAIFYSTDEVNTSGSWMHDMDYTLFPNENNGHLLHGSDRDFDEIELGDYACFTIGTGDGEGNVTLIPPASVKPIVEKFEKVYAEANGGNKRVYERAALDLYGGIDQLRALEWLCIEFQHSAYEERIWGGLKPFLEEYVKRGVDQWDAVERRERRDMKKQQEEKAKKRKREDGQPDGVSDDTKSLRTAWDF